MADATETTTVDTVTKPDGNDKQSKTYSEEAFKELIAERDKAKKQLRAIEDAQKKADEAKLVEAGKLKEALDIKEREIAELLPLKDEIERYRAQDQARHDALLEQIPEAKREIYKSLSSEQLAALVEEFKQPDPTPGKRPGKGVAERDFSELTSEERLELKSSHPKEYASRFREWYKKKNGVYPPFTV